MKTKTKTKIKTITIQRLCEILDLTYSTLRTHLGLFTKFSTGSYNYEYKREKRFFKALRKFYWIKSEKVNKRYKGKYDGIVCKLDKIIADFD